MSYSEILGDVGNRIAATRGSLSQAEFAALLGVDRKTVIRWESGERMPDGDSLLALFTQFQADPGWLLTGRGSPPPLTAREATLLQNYRSATEHGRKALEQTSFALSHAVMVARVIGASDTPAARQVFHAKVGTAVAGDVTTLNQNKPGKPKR